MDSRYELDMATGVLRPRQAKAFGYSEADEAEEHLLRLIRGVSDRSSFSPELCALMRDWSTFYHFTPKRANLLRPLRQLLAGDVLEVGCGCGAVTRYLGEVAHSVTAVEGSLRRATIARERCKDLANVTVCCDNIQDFISDRKFDVVTCIGVLEYGNIFLEGVDGVGQMLDIMRGHLNEGGVLIIAIENKLGLKYFAGSPEDHVGMAYFGIQDLYTPQTAVTFGKREIERLLNQHQFRAASFLYPFPDYKQPDTVITDEAFSLPEFPFNSVLTGCEPAVQDSGAPRPFSEMLAWPSVADNGIGGDLANSFLIVVQCQDHAPIAWRPEALVHKYATLRLKHHAKELQIVQRGGELTVRRRALFAGDGSESAAWTEEAFLPGRILLDELPKILARPKWTLSHLEQWARPWMGLLRSRCAVDGTLAPEYVDCAPFNVMRAPDGTLREFDLEWRAEGRAALDWVAFRGLFYSLDRQQGAAPAANLAATEIAEIVFTVLGGLGLPVPETRREAIFQLEGELMHSITGVDPAGYGRVLRSRKLKFKPVPKTGADAPLLCRLCWMTSTQSLETHSRQSAAVQSEPGPQTITIPIPELPQGEFELFLMPADRKGVVRLWSMTLLGEQGQKLWIWNPAKHPELPVSMTNSRLLQPMDFEPGRLVHLYTNNSFVLLPIPPVLVRRAAETGRLEVMLSWEDPVQHLQRVFDAMPAQG